MSTATLPAPAVPVVAPAAVRAWFPDDAEPAVLQQLLGWLDDNADLPPLCAEAVAGFVCAHACVEQELPRPDGGQERRPPIQPELSRPDLEEARFLYRVSAWYLDLAEGLRGAVGDWGSWQARGYRCVLTDDESNRVVVWTVRDVGHDPRSTWSMQVEGADAEDRALTFVVPRAYAALPAGGPRPGGVGPHDALGRAFLAFRQRLGRVLALLEHLDAVGVESTEEYRHWCTSHRFSDGLVKSVRERRLEIDAARRETGGADRDTWFAQVVGRLHARNARPGDLRTDYLRRIDDAFAGGLAGGARDACRDLLIHAQLHAHLGGTQPAVATLGERPGNTWAEALAELARRRRLWLRPLSVWRPEMQDPRGQFASLARHLLARYEVPPFMDTAWFRGRSRAAQQQQSWYLHVAGGGNIRTADLPLALNKRMAHCFGQAPADLTVEQALRWAQVVGQGGDDELAEAILATPLGTGFDHEDFWSTVVTWWVKHPELEPEWVAPVYDFIQYRKFEPREVALPGGEERVEPPPEPNFSRKSRSVAKLMDAIDAWHIQLAREARAAQVRGWVGADIPNFEHVEKNPDTGLVTRWRITQLRTANELFSEGRELRHCVSSYARACRDGTQSIWSLQVSDANGKNRRLATVAIDPRAGAITQIRGRHNLSASNIKKAKGGTDVIYASCVDRGRKILKRWITANGISSRPGVTHGWMG